MSLSLDSVGFRVRIKSKQKRIKKVVNKIFETGLKNGRG